MCGLFGIVYKKNLNKEKLFSTLNLLSHRGPDEDGFLESQNLFLGQKRLAIIDLSPTGKQPMKLNCSKSERKLSIVFNGEIYNFKALKKELQSLGHNFFSQSDTEVILHSYEEWGEEGIKKLRGMFACALYNEDKKEIILFRDLLGIKPLYYYLDENYFVFASEIKAFWNFEFIKKEIRKEAIFEFLQNGYLIQPKTFYQNIFALEPGSILKLNFFQNSFKIEIKKYADILDYYLLPQKNLSLNEAIQKTKNALLDSIEHHLIADVEVGLFLSGGIDSTVLLYLMRELKHSKIKTVSAIFPNTIYDESEKINELVQKFNTEHLELKITSKDFLEHLDNIFYYMDQPTIDGVNTYFVSLIAKKAGLKVVLSGLGGDELFYGYPSFFKLPKILKLKKLLKITGIGRLLEAFYKIENIQQNKLAEIIKSKNLTEEYLYYRAIFTEKQIKQIMPNIFINQNEKIDENYRQIKNILSQISYLEMQYYLKNQLLRDSDVFSMAHSIELRVPFVDNVLFENIVPIPDEYKIKNNISKFLLKEIIKDKVSENILFQKKQGFVLPIELWMKENKNLIKDEILNSEIYNKKMVEKLFNLFLANKFHWSRIWSLYVLARFLK
jgi:asparagine synthase (glutamine-hydrolysing)